MKAMGKVVLEFARDDNGRVAHASKIEGEIPYDALVHALESVKFGLLMNQAMQQQMQAMQEAQNKLVLPSGPFPRK